MPARALRAAAAALPLLFLAACLPVAPLPAPATTPPPTALEHEIHERINQYRLRRGLPALQHDPRLADLARAHSRAMAAGRRPFGHGGMQDRARAAAALVPLQGVAENVAYHGPAGPGLAAAVVEGWIRSPGHRANLAGDYDLTGVGVARQGGGPYYLTQIFVDRR